MTDIKYVAQNRRIVAIANFGGQMFTSVSDIRSLAIKCRDTKVVNQNKLL